MLNTKTTDIKTGKTNFTYDDISDYIKESNTLAIVNDSILKRGVYMSLAEFKNNQPSISEFEIKEGSIADALYVKDKNGQSFLLRNCWGYCDSRNCFIKSSDNFFMLIKSNNAFDTYGFKSFYRSVHTKMEHMLIWGMIGGGAGKTVNYGEHRHPYQLDLDTGELF